jgi:hypothetical protein
LSGNARQRADKILTNSVGWPIEAKRLPITPAIERQRLAVEKTGRKAADARLARKTGRDSGE